METKKTSGIVKRRSLVKKHPGGRPTKYSEEVVKKLEEAYKIGANQAEAVSYALISDEIYRIWLRTKPGFLERMESAKHYADIMAKKVVVRSILQDENLESAKYWLDRRAFKNPTQTNIQVNVQPLLGGESVKNVPGNYSNKENPATE